MTGLGDTTYTCPICGKAFRRRYRPGRLPAGPPVCSSECDGDARRHIRLNSPAPAAHPCREAAERNHRFYAVALLGATNNAWRWGIRDRAHVHQLVRRHWNGAAAVRELAHLQETYPRTTP